MERQKILSPLAWSPDSNFQPTLLPYPYPRPSSKWQYFIGGQICSPTHQARQVSTSNQFSSGWYAPRIGPGNAISTEIQPQHRLERINDGSKR